MSTSNTNMYIGLMSGTSADSIDAALVDFSGDKTQLMGYSETPLEPGLRQQVLDLMNPGDNEIDRLGQVDHLLGHAFAQAVLQLLKSTNTPANQVRAIGCHGQTIRHRPPAQGFTPFTLQIGDANIITHETGIDTVADFRRRDMAAGGQGAPLVPAFHKGVFSSAGEHRVIVNIGGMANITILNDQPVRGFDTGPGNGVMDSWIALHKGDQYDENGVWAASGTPDPDLIADLLADPYFQQAPPKSTGRESFNLDWLQNILASHKTYAPSTVQASLLEVTAQSIIQSITEHAPATQGIYVCGGGVFNKTLMARLRILASENLPNAQVDSTKQLGIDPQSVEAAAFAWLAKQRIEKLPGNSPETTGANKALVLGCIYPA